MSSYNKKNKNWKSKNKNQVYFYKKYDIVNYHNIHNNVFFQKSKENNPLNVTIEKDEQGNYKSDFIKTRPALILERISNNKFLIVPFTTKEESNPKVQYNYRNYFKPFDQLDSEGNEVTSFLKWDAIKIVSSNELGTQYKRRTIDCKTNKIKYSNFSISDSSKRWLKKNIWKNV